MSIYSDASAALPEEYNEAAQGDSLILPSSDYLVVLPETKEPIAPLMLDATTYSNEVYSSYYILESSDTWEWDLQTVSNTQETIPEPAVQLDLRDKQQFWKKLHTYLQDKQKRMDVYPHIAYAPIDLYTLFQEINANGGYQVVCDTDPQDDGWSPLWEVVFKKVMEPVLGTDIEPALKKLKVIPSIEKKRRTKLKEIYETLLLGFEKESKKREMPIGTASEHWEFIRCVCGHTHAHTGAFCRTCDRYLQASGNTPDFVMCECCFGWHHVPCMIELQFLTPAEQASLERRDPGYTFYCEVCSNKKIPMKWCGKLLEHELPVEWTCERRKRKSGKDPNKQDWYIMKPESISTGRFTKASNVIRSVVHLEKELPDA